MSSQKSRIYHTKGVQILLLQKRNIILYWSMLHFYVLVRCIAHILEIGNKTGNSEHVWIPVQLCLVSIFVPLLKLYYYHYHYYFSQFYLLLFSYT